MATEGARPARCALTDDGSVRLWGVEQQLMLAMRLLPRGVGSLAYSADGLHLAAGCADGHVTVLHADSLEVGDYNT